MVDSAVTLSIGTELDLSGLQRDLAALKSQKFNFDFDADKIGRSFREANRQMQLKPRVDLSELHELNRLLDVKLNHVKKVQKYFDANPLKVRVDNRETEKILANLGKSSVVTVKTVSKENASILGELRQISKNTQGKGGVGAFVGSIVTAPLKLSGKLIGDAFTGFGEEIGRTLSQEIASGSVKKGVEKTRKAIKAINDYFIGSDKVYETLLAEILRSGDINKAGKAAFKRTSAAKELERLQKLQEIATIPAKEPKKRLKAIRADKELSAIFDAAIESVGKNAPNASKREQQTLVLNEFFEKAVPQGIVQGVVNPLIKEMQPLLRFIQGMQAYNTNVLAERFYKERKASFPLIQKGQSVVSVIGGAQGEKGQGGRKIAMALQGIAPDTRFIPVENPDTDNGDRNPLENWFKEQLKSLEIPKDVESTVLNAFRQISYSLSPTGSSVAAAQALANARLTQEQGGKASAVTYSLGGAEGIRLASAAQYGGVKDIKTLAMAYPFLNLLGQDPEGFMATMLKGDALGFATKFNIGTPSKQFMQMESNVFGAEAHAPYHLFEKLDFLQAFFDTLGQEMPDIDPSAASDVIRFGNQLYELLGVAEQVKSLATTGEFNLQVPFKGFKGTDVTGESLIERFGESFSLLESMQRSSSPQIKKMAQSLQPVFDEVKNSLVVFAESVGVELPEDLSKNFAGFLKFNAKLEEVNKTLTTFKSGVLPEKPDEAYFAGNLNPVEVSKRMSVLENETISWFKANKGKFGDYGDDLVRIFEEVKRVADEFVATGGQLSDEFKATIEEFPAIALPDEFKAITEKRLNTMSLPSEEQARQNLVEVPSVFKKNQAAILAYNQLLEMLDGKIIPSLKEIEAVAYGMSGAAALIGKELVYKTDLDPEGLAKIASPQEMAAYERLGGRLSPLMYKGVQGKALVTERVKGKSLKDILDRIAQPITELSNQLDVETDESKRAELQKKINDTKARFNKAAEILYTQVGQLGAAMQEMGVVHNDLASGNVFFTKEGIKAIDLGNAKIDPTTKDKLMDQATTIQRAIIDRAFYGILDPLRATKAIQTGYATGMAIPQKRTPDLKLLEPEMAGTVVPLGSKTPQLLNQYVGELMAFPERQLQGQIEKIDAEKGKLATIVDEKVGTLARKVESVVVGLFNNALMQVPGQPGTLDLGAPQISGFKDINANVMGLLAGKGIQQTAITGTKGVFGAYGALQGAENAFLGLDPSGAAKAFKNVAAPLALTAAASQVPGVGMIVSGAVNATAGALAPLGNVLGGEIISAMSGAVSGAVGSLPIIGGSLEAGLVAMITNAVTAAIAGAGGIAAAGVVGRGMQLGTGAIGKAIAPGVDVQSQAIQAKTQKALTGALVEFEKITQSLSKSQLPGTTSVFPSLLPPVQDKEQLKGLLGQNLKLSGVQEVFSQLTKMSGKGMSKNALIEAIAERLPDEPAKIQQAIAKVSPEGLKKGADITTIGRPTFNETKFIEDLQKVAKGSRLFVTKFDQADMEIRKQTADGLAKLVEIVEFQLKAIETAKTEFTKTGKGAQKLGGYESELKAQLQQLQARQQIIGGQIGGDIVAGLAKGVEANQDIALRAVQGMADDVIDTTKQRFGIQSPSKVFKAIGRDIIRGLQIGGDPSPYINSLLQSFDTLKRQLQGQQSALGKQLQIETDEDSIRYIKAQIAVIDEWKKELIDVNASVELLKNSMGDLSNETTKKLFADLTKQAVVLGQKIEQVTNPRKTPSSTKSTDLIPVQSRVATASTIPQFNLDAVFEAAEEAQQQLSETEFEIGDLNADNWIDSIAEVITGIKGITSKSWKEIGSEFAKNFKTEGIKKAFGELQETVKGSFSRIFAGAFGDEGAPSRFIQGVIGNLTIGLTQLTNVLATRLDSILTAVNETLNGALEGISNFSENITQNLGKIALIAVQAFALVGIVRGMTALGQAAFQTALEVEQLTRSLSFSSAEGGVATLDMIKQKAEELSLSFVEAAQGYSQLAASTLGTSLESQTEDIFTGVSTAIAARGLGKEQQSRAFLAISQIASKGRVSLEELNGQLGEALPGALQTAARALGVTSAELIKLVSTGQVTADEFLPKFADQLALEAGSSVAAAANTATAQLVKFENRLTNIRAELGKGILTPLAAVLPIVNGALKILADNMTLVLGVVTSISAVMAFNLAKALILVAAQFKLVNLALATFGITLEQQVNAVTGKTTVKVIGLQGAIMGLGNAFKMMALQAAPLLILATVVSRIQAATKPLNEDIAKTNKEFISAINNAKRLRAERERKSEQGGQQTPTGDYQLFGELYGGKNQQRMLGVGVALNKFLPFMQFGRNKELTQVAETFIDIQTQARLAKEDADLAVEGYNGLSEAQKQQLQENEKATRLKGTELQVASAKGLDTTQLKADLDGLRQKREEILDTIQGYDQLVAASNRVDSAISNLNALEEEGLIGRQVYNKELARLTEQKERLSVLLDDYAEGTRQITNNVRALASEIQKVSVEFQNAQLNAERTASMAQMELIKGRLSGKVSAPEFARQQTAIANQQTTATKDAAIAARDAALKAIQSIDNTTLGLELETAFGDQLATVLSDGTVEAVEAARARLSQDGKELDPAIETALNSIQEYIGLRNQAFELEKQTLEQQLENRQQAADILQQEIDLLNERAQFEIDTKSLQAEIEQMRKMGAGVLSEFQAQQLSATQESALKRQEAARLRTSATEAQLAAQNPDILPEARQRFLRDAQRQNLEAQLKEQEALYAESQARIARELRPLDLAKEQIDINLNAAQQQASVQMNRAMASSALSSFQKEMMQGGSAINQLLFEAQNESFLAQMERGKAGIKGLSPDKRKELLISAQQRENLAAQKRSEAELQQVELQRNKQIRDFEIATKQAAIANDQFYQSRKNAILSEQANAKTVGDIATANIIAQKKQLDLEIEYTKRKLALNQQQLTSNENLYRRGIIDIDTYNENYSQLTTERLNLQESVTNQQIQLNQQEIDNFQKLAEQLKSVNSIREAVLEAQIKGQERAAQAANVYGDALSKQGELIQAQSKVKGFRSNEKILAAELEISRLNQQSEGMSEEEKAGIQAKIQKQSLKIAQEKAKLLEQEQETQRKLLALEIERNKIAAQQQIKEAEIGALRARNAVVAAQIAVKEKAATGNQDEIIQAQLGLELATEEFQFALAQIDISKQNAVINDQLSALERQGLLGEQNLERQRQAGEFRLQFKSEPNPFARGINKQKAVITNQLAALQRQGLLGKQNLERQRRAFDGGFGFSLDPSVQALANMGADLANITDFSKYDALLSQLDRAAQPLEAQLATQTNAIKATNDLTGAITSLNEKITGLVTTLGRPNISVSGGSSIAEAVELMRMTK